MRSILSEWHVFSMNEVCSTNGVLFFVVCCTGAGGLGAHASVPAVHGIREFLCMHGIRCRALRVGPTRVR